MGNLYTQIRTPQDRRLEILSQLKREVYAFPRDKKKIFALKEELKRIKPKQFKKYIGLKFKTAGGQS